MLGGGVAARPPRRSAAAAGVRVRARPDADVYCYMGLKANGRIVTIPGVPSATDVVVPAEAVAWCQAGDAGWTWIKPEEAAT